MPSPDVDSKIEQATKSLERARSARHKSGAPQTAAHLREAINWCESAISQLGHARHEPVIPSLPPDVPA